MSGGTAGGAHLLTPLPAAGAGAAPVVPNGPSRSNTLFLDALLMINGAAGGLMEEAKRRRERSTQRNDCMYNQHSLGRAAQDCSDFALMAIVAEFGAEENPRPSPAMPSCTAGLRTAQHNKIPEPTPQG